MHTSEIAMMMINEFAFDTDHTEETTFEQLDELACALQNEIGEQHAAIIEHLEAVIDNAVYNEEVNNFIAEILKEIC